MGGAVQPPPCGCVLKHTYSILFFIKFYAAASVRLCVETSVVLYERIECLVQPPPCGCVLKRSETVNSARFDAQPPPCGCVLKPCLKLPAIRNPVAAASVRLCVETAGRRGHATVRVAAASVRLCVETFFDSVKLIVLTQQPPPCGCVLKRLAHSLQLVFVPAAASVRLCVETPSAWQICRYAHMQPPPCGCVLKPINAVSVGVIPSAATFGWLCVETSSAWSRKKPSNAATFGWLCVETFITHFRKEFFFGSHLRVAVC